MTADPASWHHLPSSGDKEGVELLQGRAPKQVLSPLSSPPSVDLARIYSSSTLYNDNDVELAPDSSANSITTDVIHFLRWKTNYMSSSAIILSL